MPSDIQETIAAQVANTKPDHLRPGLDVGMEEGADDNTLVVSILSELIPGNRAIVMLDRTIRITYVEGRDTYDVVVERQDGAQTFEDVYCDMLGQLVFGDEAKSFSMPMVVVTTWDDEGNAEHKVF